MINNKFQLFVVVIEKTSEWPLVPVDPTPCPILQVVGALSLGLDVLHQWWSSTISEPGVSGISVQGLHSHETSLLSLAHAYYLWCRPVVQKAIRVPIWLM